MNLNLVQGAPKVGGRRWQSLVTLPALAVIAISFLAAAPLETSESTQTSAVETRGLAAPVRQILGARITVSNMDRAKAFYEDVLTFETLSDDEYAGAAYEQLTGVFGVRIRVVRMRLGGEEIELTQFMTHEGRPVPRDSASNDRWFQHIAIITPDMEAAYSRLRNHKVQYASTEPQRLPDWNPNAGGIKAFYFRDPDNHVLEILSFPDGKGDPKWRRLAVSDPQRLFLGIDHTAIVIGDTAESLKFYRDRLGLQIAGTSENYGIEQEHLNNVLGARLRITSVRPPTQAQGPSVEFLHYLTPQTGRLYPTDTRANDLWNWEITLSVSRIEDALAAVPASQLNWVSNGIVSMPDDSIGFARAAVIRDPDGHALRFVEESGVGDGQP